MVYRICKSFEVESGHMLSKHPGRCRFPHGHSRRVDVVLSSPSLDQNDMVCDFSTVKYAVGEFIDRLDHAMAMNSQDPRLGELSSGSDPVRNRVVVFEGQDPTTEVLARSIFDYLVELIGSGREIEGGGRRYRFPSGVTVERVRVGETSTSWAEYGR
jgi:6-pyruvoyltetrahydropterin/6-carboxytetrahydropterin synthase